MSQDTLSPESHLPGPTIAQGEALPKRPRSKWIRRIGIGCLVIILLIGIGFAVLYFSGVLSGPHGDRDGFPAWSPEGNRIAFMSNRDGFSDIYVMNADGSHVVQLTRDPLAELYFPKSATDTTPAWSPDGKQIAFTSGRDNGMMTYVDLNIFKMNADGSRVIDLNHHDSIDQSPAWSPDGKQIAYASAEGFYSGGQLRQDPTFDIRVMDVDGSHDIQLTNESGNEYGIAWSPDGSQIAFISDNSGNSDLYLMKPDGSDVVPLTTDPSNEGAPTWSPDGKRIAFVSDRSGKTAIYAMDVDGSNIVQLTGDQSNAYNPAWSPDGQHIAFVSDLTGNYDIYVMNSDGSNIVQLTGK